MSGGAPEGTQDLGLLRGTVLQAVATFLLSPHVASILAWLDDVQLSPPLRPSGHLT